MECSAEDQECSERIEKSSIDFLYRERVTDEQVALERTRAAF
jgi:hypothetical protein